MNAPSTRRLIDEDEVEGAVEAFDGVWSAMTQAERAELMQSTVERVEYDGGAQSVTVTFRTPARGEKGPAAHV